MAKQKITYEPQILALILYAGDGPTFKLTVTDPDGVAIPLTGTMIAQIRASREAIDPPSAEFNVDLSNSANGVVELSLTGVQTHALITGNETFNGVWDLEWTPSGGEPMTICQGKVECAPDVSH
jgi:hypothetical protein